ncbi:unnamed protein product [Vicia faba]|uniref:Uncharacterized protein n=1 Tax=Vicia faba TaxID=3906 RepID=A0AAV0ZPN6_VICFA|nr:unnamed protein product [Vicia faba]
MHLKKTETMTLKMVMEIKTRLNSLPACVGLDQGFVVAVGFLFLLLSVICCSLGCLGIAFVERITRGWSDESCYTRKFCMVLKENCSQQDMLKALFQISLEYAEREFDHVRNDGESVGWITYGLNARPLPNRIRPSNTEF